MPGKKVISEYREDFMYDNDSNTVKNLIKIYTSEFDNEIKETAVILAAGHGKRIKSQTSKMLHPIWGVPTVQRVYDACAKGFDNVNTVVVVGIKAEDVIKVIGKRNNTLFAYQEVQHGTGHAVQVGLESIDRGKYDGIVYVLPGDMGLIDATTMKFFKEEFKKSGRDMMVLTGLFEGDSADNAYGRIVRVKDKDVNGNPAGEDEGKVIQIIEQKDILALGSNEHVLEYNGKKYAYTQEELIENPEFNSGVYAFKSRYLLELIDKLSSDNAQGEIYITDLISLFNQQGLTVGAVSPVQQHVIMGFNNKAVLKEMDAIARKMAYERIKNIVDIADPDDFFIHDSVIDQIVKMDEDGTPLDIKIGKGVHLGKGVQVNYNLELKKNVYVDGNVIFGKNVKVWENVHLSCFPKQKLELNNNVELLWGNIIKGNIVIGENSRIESSVNMTGSDDYPTTIGKNVTIKGTSYVFGSKIDDDLFIEHSVLIRKRVDKLIKKDGRIQKIRFFIPMPEGIDAIETLE